MILLSAYKLLYHTTSGINPCESLDRDQEARTVETYKHSTTNSIVNVRDRKSIIKRKEVEGRQYMLWPGLAFGTHPDRSKSCHPPPPLASDHGDLDTGDTDLHEMEENFLSG